MGTLATHSDPLTTDTFRAHLATNGWATTPPLVPEPDLAALESALAPLLSSAAPTAGLRNLLRDSAAVQSFVRTPALRALASAVLGPACAAVRVIWFDKTPAANWRVTWHQDLTIAVAARCDVDGYGPWSEKDGVVHVQPPVRVLEQMLAVRVHLDDCDADNGPVRVLSGSHRAGRLGPAEINEWKERVPAEECLAARGAVLAFRPLLLHASSPARVARHRRVLHIEYAAPVLDERLAWDMWVGGE
jgi:hypothetical protein